MQIQFPSCSSYLPIHMQLLQIRWLLKGQGSQHQNKKRHDNKQITMIENRKWKKHESSRTNTTASPKQHPENSASPQNTAPEHNTNRKTIAAADSNSSHGRLKQAQKRMWRSIWLNKTVLGFENVNFVEDEFWRERDLIKRINLERNNFKVWGCEFWKRWILIKQDGMVGVGAEEFWRERDEQNRSGKKYG